MRDNQSELFTQVDAHDQVIGPVTRAHAHADKTIIHRSIGILLKNKQGELLFQKRSALKDKNPGMWTYSVGGHVTYGDSYKATAERELAEELGLTVPFQFVAKTLVQMESETEFTAFFVAEVDEPALTLATDEIDEVKWVSVNDVAEFVKTHQVVDWAVVGLKVTGYLK